MPREQQLIASKRTPTSVGEGPRVEEPERIGSEDRAGPLHHARTVAFLVQGVCDLACDRVCAPTRTRRERRAPSLSESIRLCVLTAPPSNACASPRAARAPLCAIGWVLLGGWRRRSRWRWRWRRAAMVSWPRPSQGGLLAAPRGPAYGFVPWPLFKKVSGTDSCGVDPN